jgi:hypothetical protein
VLTAIWGRTEASTGRGRASAPNHAKGPGSARRPGYWAAWSQKYDWVDRAEAYDDLIDEERRTADTAQRQKLQEHRSQFAVEEQQREQNLVREADAVLHTALTASRAEVTKVKTDEAAGTETTTKIKPSSFRDIAALMGALDKTAKQAIEGVDSKDPAREERRVERIVWMPAKDRNPAASDPPKYGQENGQPSTDAPLADLEEDQAA